MVRSYSPAPLRRTKLPGMRAATLRSRSFWPSSRSRAAVAATTSRAAGDRAVDASDRSGRADHRARDYVSALNAGDGKRACRRARRPGQGVGDRVPPQQPGADRLRAGHRAHRAAGGDAATTSKIGEVSVNGRSATANGRPARSRPIPAASCSPTRTGQLEDLLSARACRRSPASRAGRGARRPARAGLAGREASRSPARARRTRRWR